MKQRPSDVAEHPGRERTRPTAQLGAVNESLAATERSLIQQVQDGQAELHNLQERMANAHTFEYVDPNDIDYTPLFPNRDESDFQDDTYEALKRDIRENGEPDSAVRLRPYTATGKKYVIVYGHRRSRACKEVGVKVKAEIKAIDDKEHFIIAMRENAERKQPGDIKLAEAYKAQLDSGIFKSQNELAKSIKGLSQPMLSRLLSLLAIPEEITSAFEDRSFLTVHRTDSLVKTLRIPERRFIYEQRMQLFYDAQLPNEQLLKIISDFSYFVRLTEHREDEQISMSERIDSLNKELEQETLDLEIERRITEEQRLDQEQKELSRNLAKTSDKPKTQTVDLSVGPRKVGAFSRTPKGKVSIKFNTDNERFGEFVALHIPTLHEQFLKEELEKGTEPHVEPASV